MAKTKLKPTSGKKWREMREVGALITLPSGNVVRMRPVALDRMILHGQIPDLLSPVAALTLWKDDATKDLINDGELTKRYLELVDIVCEAAVIEPKIVAQAEHDDEITLEDIDIRDKMWIFQIAMQPVEVLRRFREQQEASLESVPDGEDVGAAAKRLGIYIG